MKFNHYSANKVGIVANDAGAANLIKGLIENYENYSYIYCLDGPAINIFKKDIPDFVNLEIDDLINDSDFLITGTSFYSMLEFEARKKALKNKVFNVAVVDHWVNYEIRFIRDRVKILPDEIWVFDDAAFVKANKLFENILIREFPNYYLKDVVRRINKIKIKKFSNQINILYVLEPLRQNWIKDKKSGEIEVLEFFIRNIAKIDKNCFLKIKLRPHPSHARGKFENWVNRNNLFSIDIDYENSLDKCISWADIVVGCETFAMVIADSAGKRCICSFPKYASKCSLEIENIEYLRDL